MTIELTALDLWIAAAFVGVIWWWGIMIGRHRNSGRLEHEYEIVHKKSAKDGKYRSSLRRGGKHYAQFQHIEGSENPAECQRNTGEIARTLNARVRIE